MGRPIGRYFGEGFARLPVGPALVGELLVQLGAAGFPLQHFIADLFDDLGGIAYDEASRRNFHGCWHETEGANDAFVAHDGFIHDDGVHTDEHVTANGSAVHDGAVANVGCLFEADGDARKHVYGAVFLHVTTVFDDDFAPVTPDGGTRSDVHVFANNDIASDRCSRMHEGRGMNHWPETIEFVKHEGVDSQT